MKRMLIAVAVLLLAGCMPSKWTKAGGTEQEFAQAKAQCMYESDLHTQGSNTNAFAALQLVPECLRAKGWTSQ